MKINKVLKIIVSYTLLSWPAHCLFAQDITNLGGELTSSLPAKVALELPAPNLTDSDAIERHLSSHEDFHNSFLTRTYHGHSMLGPNFNHNACGACHIHNGRGAFGFVSGSDGSALLVKVGLPGLNADASPKSIPTVGEQLQDHTIAGRQKYDIRLRWRAVPGKYPDGTKFNLRRPILTFSIPNLDSDKVVFSLRMTPPVIGMGLLEAVPDQTLIDLSDAQDANHDGISGKVSRVIDHATGQSAIGRFGFRASQPSVKNQSAAAFFNDMGVSNEIFKGKNDEQELDSQTLQDVVFYLQLAAVTPARDQDKSTVIAGKALFQSVGCSDCHTMTLSTGDSEISQLAHQEFHPFTDLLLHDMGPMLADKRKEFSANGREWRTTPLWGLGLFYTLSHKRPGFMHDSRARTIEEAILWHDGEARAARRKFMALSKLERSYLLDFLNSL